MKNECDTSEKWLKGLLDKPSTYWIQRGLWGIVLIYIGWAVFALNVKIGEGKEIDNVGLLGDSFGVLNAFFLL